MNKKHLSPTQLGMYLRCGEQYRRRYIEKEIVPPGIALIKGGSVHKAAETNFRQKIESREDLPIKDIREAAAANFDGQIASGYILDPDERAIGAKKVLGVAKDSTIKLVDIYVIAGRASHPTIALWPSYFLGFFLSLITITLPFLG